MKHKRFFEASNLYSNSFSIILGLLFLFPTTFFAKNKKEQIKSLASNNDSLSLLLTIERGVFEKEKLDREIQGLEIGNKKSLSEIAVLNLENNVCKQENLNICKNIELFNYIKNNLSYDKLIMQDNNIIHISYKTNDTNEYKVYKTNSFGNLEKI